MHRSTLFNTNSDLVYIGDESGEQTNCPDCKYNDGGKIYFGDGVYTGWENQPELKIYHDSTVIRVN